MYWKIYYGDGSTFSSEDGDWCDAPGWDCQVVIYQNLEGGWTIRHGGDFFMRDALGEVINIDMIGLVDYIINELGIFKTGRMLSTNNFDRVYQRAKVDLAELRKK